MLLTTTFLLAPVGARRPSASGVRAMAVGAAPAKVGSGRIRALPLVTRVAAGAGKALVVPSSVVVAAGKVNGVYIRSIGSKERSARGPRMLLSSGISSATLARASRVSHAGGGFVVAATPGSEGPGDNNYTKLGGFVAHNILTTLAQDAVSVFDDLVPATAKAQLPTKYSDVKTGLEMALMLAPGCSNKVDAAQEIMRGWYGIVELAHASYPDASLPALPGKQAFLDLCLAAGDESVILGQAVGPLVAPYKYTLAGYGMPDSDVDLIRSVFIAVLVCQAAVKTATRANLVSGEPYIV